MLRLSDDIGVMADRILEMADKILIKPVVRKSLKEALIELGLKS